MLVLTGTLLVVLTWAVLIGGVALVGAPLACLTHRDAVSWNDVRRGLWWGLTVTAALAMLIGAVTPLGGGGAAGAVVGLVAAGGLATAFLIRRRGWKSAFKPTHVLLPVLLLSASAFAYLAVAALGPVTNVDSGLYHLSAILHAREGATVPGLANLQSPLGYGNASFPLAALLGSSPWGPDGFRLLNGLIIAAVLADLLIRWAQPRRTPGDYGLLVGAVVLLVPMVALADYWVTSPSQDSAVFAVTVAASAMLMDGVARTRHRLANIGTALAASILLVLLRPTMAAYLVGILVVAALLMRRSRDPWIAWRRPALVLVGVGVFAATAQVVRDALLSGWILYPLSLVSLDVPWRSADPTSLREATLGYHRDPSRLWESAQDWSWVGPWLGRLPGQWESWLVGALLVTVALSALMARLWHVDLRLRGMALATAPSALMALVWWAATPPSFRFVWGPLFTMLTIPLAWIVWRTVWSRWPTPHARPDAVIAWLGATAVIAVVGVSSLTRLDTSAITQERHWEVLANVPYAVAPLPATSSSEVALARGLIVQVPNAGFACWDSSLLCTPEADGYVGFLDPAAGLAGGLSRE